jgi:peptide/nickel transport system substrate-binding protein
MLILASCAEETPTTTAPTPAETAAPTTAAPSSIKIAVIGNLLTGVDATTSAGEPYVADNVFDRLVPLSTSGQPMSSIADMKILDNGKLYEFTLHKGIKFSNGDPMTTKDVEFSFNRILEKNLNFVAQLKNFDRLEVVDDYTIRFYFKDTYVLFPYLSAPRIYIASKNYYDKVGEDAFIVSPVGSGPYKIADWKVGEYVDLVVNENYWGQKPQIQQARIVFAKEDSTRVAMLQSGEVDMVSDTPYQMVANLESAGFQRTDIEKFARTWVITFNLLNPDTPWADLRVRQAVAYAIDRESLVKNVFFGIPKIYAWLAPGELGYDPDIKPYPYDISKAKQLLAEAGYSDGFEMPLYYVSAMIGSRDVVDYLANALNAINIKCKITALASMTEYLELLRKWHQDPTSVCVNLSATIIPFQAEPSSGISFMFDSRAPTVLFGWPELNAVIDEMTKEVDTTKRGELIKQAVEIINTNLPMITILTNVNVFMRKANIDFVPTEANSSSVFVGMKDIKVK